MQTRELYNTMDISRSGRIRKKSSKLADFESPDEIEGVNPIRKTPKISVSNKDQVGLRLFAES